MYPSFASAVDAGVNEMMAAKDKNAVSGRIVSAESKFEDGNRFADVIFTEI